MDLKTLHKISYGLYIVCSRKKDKINGQIANALFQVTSQPPTIALSINKNNLTHSYIKDSNFLTISVLSEETPMKLIGNFGFKSGRNHDKFKEVNYKLSNNNIPIVLDYSTAYIEIKIENSIDFSTHTIFVGEVKDAEILSDKSVMTYEYYHSCKGGTSPKIKPPSFNPLEC